MAVKLPAAAIIVVTCGGASFLASRTAHTPSPPPSAISGASGPSTTPRLSVANAARNHARQVGQGWRRPSRLESVGR